VSKRSASVELEEEFGHQPPDWLKEIASSSGIKARLSWVQLIYD